MKTINTTHELKNFIKQLSQSDFVTVDTEFIRESTYWPQLCLVQLASPEVSGLVDPMSAELDLQPFFALMKNQAITKVFHSARQDIEIIHHLSGIIPAPLFDTQVAAMVCGYGEAISYDQIVARIAGVQIDKSSRYTNWAHRPLSEKQLNYALADVTHLRDVYISLQQHLDKTGRQKWLDDEIAILSSPKTYDVPLETVWKRVKGRIKKPIELAVLQKIAAWRETLARQHNIPRGRILKDESLIEIATQRPTDDKALSQLRSLPQRWERSKYSIGLIEAIHKGLDTPKDALPTIKKHRSPVEGSGAAIDLLKVLLKLVAHDNQVAAKVLANSDDIEKIVHDGREADIPAMHGWRYEMYGQKALEILDGKLGFRFENKQIVVFALDE